MNRKSFRNISKFVATLMATVLLSSPVVGVTGSVRAAPGDITRVSVDSFGAQANNASKRPSVSSDGRFVAFESDASNLVSGDTNSSTDIFVRDRQTSQITRVSISSSGSEANEGSGGAAISSDGRYVAFISDASNLVANDTNNTTDVFVRDLQLGTTIRVSVSTSGEQANDFSDFPVSISSDGRYIAFHSDATNLVANDTNDATDVFVHDNQTGATERVSIASDGTQSNGASFVPSISSNGQYVVFTSGATNLVNGDTNNKPDVFVRDRLSNTTTRVSVNTSGEQADGGGSSPAISGDGRFVVFLSDSGNLAPGVDDYRGKKLVYVHDRQIGQTTLASAYSDGRIMTVGLLDQPTISSNGRYVAFSFYDKSDNNGIMNIWVRDLQMGESIRVSGGNDSSFGASLSANGGIVAFWSGASNLVSGDTNGVSDIFVGEVAYGTERNPTVASITPKCGRYNFQCPYPTPSSVSFIVIFSEQVTGVSADDFSLEMLDGITGASITGVSGFGSEYFVAVNTGTGEGKLRLKLLDNDSIKDTSLNPLGGAGTGNGDFTTGDLYWIDKNNPIVTSITRADPNPAAVGTVRFTVTFSEGVWPVDPGVFVLFTTGSLSGANVTEISPRADEFQTASTYTVTVSTGSGDGTLRLDLNDDDSIRDWRDNPLGGVGAGNGSFNTGETYSIGNSAPSVTGIIRMDANPTAATQVRFLVNFSEPVNGVDAGDFAVTATGTITGVSLTEITGLDSSYTVTVNTGTGDGTIRLDLLDNDSIVDQLNTPLGGIGAGNGSFTTGEDYTLNRSAPAAISILRADPNPTTAENVRFTVTFSEAVTGVDVSDFALATTGSVVNAIIKEVSGSGTLYTVTVGTGVGSGTLRLDLMDNDSIVDGSSLPLGGFGAGNGNFTLGEEYSVNKSPVVILTETFGSNGTNDGWVLESSEDSNQGGAKNAKDIVFRLGDDAQDRQYRAILHFPTYYLPDNAVVTEVILLLKRQGVVGTDPFTTHGGISIDLRSGVFGNFGPFGINALQASDFQNPASLYSAGLISNNPVGDWYVAALNSAANPFINLTGITQLRLAFQLDDNDDLGDDYITFYSGNDGLFSNRPHLVVKYYIPK
jgi:hypothetical protein